MTIPHFVAPEPDEPADRLGEAAQLVEGPDRELNSRGNPLPDEPRGAGDALGEDAQLNCAGNPLPGATSDGERASPSGMSPRIQCEGVGEDAQLNCAGNPVPGDGSEKRDDAASGMSPRMQCEGAPPPRNSPSAPSPAAPSDSPPHAGEGPGERFARVIAGLDWGYTNPTAAVVFGLDGDDRAWQLAELYLPRASLHETVYPALLELTAKWAVGVWYAGPDEPEHIAGLRLALERAGMVACPVVAADDAVVAGIQTVTRQLARRADGTRGLYVDPSCRWTIAEYASYQYPPAELAGGMRADVNVRRTDDGPEGPGLGAGTLSELPLKANDHLMDATRYALHTHFAQVRAAQRTDGWLARWLPEGTIPTRRRTQFAGSSRMANMGDGGAPSHCIRGLIPVKQD